MAAATPRRRRRLADDAKPSETQVRFRFSIPIDGRTTAEFAMSRLNRKLQRAGVMKKLRTRNRGFVKQSRIKYDTRLKRARGGRAERRRSGRVAAPPRPRAGYSAETSRDAAAAARAG